DRPTGTELLFAPHWTPAPLDAARRSEDAWTHAWGGGWNLLVPNAGAACTVGGHLHPFHGDASCSGWTVEACAPPAARLPRRSFAGLAVARTVTVEDARVSVRTSLENRGRVEAPYVMVEHLILGEALLDPAAVVEVGDALVTRLADEGPPLSDAPSPWPTA